MVIKNTLFTLVLAVAVSFSAVNAGPCEDGFRAGRQAVRNIWERDLDEDCDNAWDLKGEARRTKTRRFQGGRNWRKRLFNECAGDGVDEIIQDIEDECFNQNSGQCMSLAVGTAEKIVRQNLCTPKRKENRLGWRARSSAPKPDYRKSCKDVGVNHCPSKIENTITSWCPEKLYVLDRTDRRLSLENECQDTVDELLGD